jgi:hypothetical protein
MDETGSGLSSMVSFGISDVETMGSDTKVKLTFSKLLKTKHFINHFGISELF